jgi:hypothetical protein
MVCHNHENVFFCVLRKLWKNFILSTPGVRSQISDRKSGNLARPPQLCSCIKPGGATTDTGAAHPRSGTRKVPGRQIPVCVTSRKLPTAPRLGRLLRSITIALSLYLIQGWNGTDKLGSQVFKTCLGNARDQQDRRLHQKLGGTEVASVLQSNMHGRAADLTLKYLSG